MNSKELKVKIYPELQKLIDDIKNNKIKEILEITGSMESFIDAITNTINAEINNAAENPSDDWYNDCFFEYAEIYNNTMEKISALKDSEKKPFIEKLNRNLPSVIGKRLAELQRAYYSEKYNCIYHNENYKFCKLSKISMDSEIEKILKN